MFNEVENSAGMFIKPEGYTQGLFSEERRMSCLFTIKTPQGTFK